MGIKECFGDAGNINVIVMKKVCEFILFVTDGAGVTVKIVKKLTGLGIHDFLKS